jgi:origin recognition complex subunit 6
MSEARILALIAVIFFYVRTRMMDQDITPEQFLEWKEKAVSTLLESPAGKQCAEGDIHAEIEKLMPMAQEEGWLRMEWFLNIFPENEGEGMEGVELSNGGNGSGIAKKRRKSLKESFGSEYIGLGTMMQDATDYLGERQREDYKRWKMGIMARIEEIEAS